MKMNRTLAAVLAVAAALAAGGAAAADIEAGKKKAQEVCAACHNMDGVSTIADYPKLAGQYPEYMAKALRDYKSGARKDDRMAPVAQMLERADMLALAEYFSKQRSATR